jgi:hypothetical protein
VTDHQLLELLGPIVLGLLLVLSVAGAADAVVTTVRHARRARAIRTVRDAQRAVDAFYGPKAPSTDPAGRR